MLLNSHIKTEVNNLVDQRALQITNKTVTSLMNV